MASLVLSFAPADGRTAQSDSHRLGNIADAIWPEMILHDRYEVSDQRYYALMKIIVGRPLRNKERDELKRRLKLLSNKQPELDVRLEG